MKHWILIASVIVAGLYLARATYRAGLRRFGVAIAVTTTLGWLAIGLEYWVAGVALVGLWYALGLGSRWLMKTHGVGPFGPHALHRPE